MPNTLLPWHSLNFSQHCSNEKSIFNIIPYRSQGRFLECNRIQHNISSVTPSPLTFRFKINSLPGSILYYIYIHMYRCVSVLYVEFISCYDVRKWCLWHLTKWNVNMNYLVVLSINRPKDTYVSKAFYEININTQK